MPDGVNIPGGPGFAGSPKPPDVPCDPTGDAWRGEPGPPGPPGAVGGVSGGTLAGPLYWTATGSTTSRSAQDRSHDRINVLDFGARLDGTTFDDAAYAVARGATSFHGEVFVPRGVQHVGAPPTGGPSGPVLWRMDGVTFDGTNPVNGMGTDIVENFIGAKFFGRSGSFASCGPVLRVDQVLNHNTGTSGVTNVSFAVNTSTSGASIEGVFGINSTINSSKNGGGDLVAVSGYVNKTANYTNAYGANFYASDQTGLASSLSGASVGAEIGVIANGIDDGGVGGVGVRVVLDAIGAKQNPSGPDVAIRWGIRCGPSAGLSGVTFGTHYSGWGPFAKASFSTVNATQNTGAHAIWLADGHRIALDTAGTRTLSYDSASGKIFLAVSGVNRLSIDAAGNVRASGTITGSVTP